jgi:mono/diheme cytochrome c family protein
MNEKKISWLLVIGGGVIVGLFLVACLGLALWLPGLLGGVGGTSRFESNGAQIYFTATSQRGTIINSDVGPGMGRRQGSRMTCASCHGPDGRGGEVRMMMRVIEAPDIRYETLTSQEHDGHGEEGEEEHAPYTEKTIRRAITEGVEPEGEPLDWPMPRWSMSDEDLDDLVNFLKALD